MCRSLPILTIGGFPNEKLPIVSANVRSRKRATAWQRTLWLRYTSGHFQSRFAYVGGTGDQREQRIRDNILLRMLSGLRVLPELFHFVRTERKGCHARRSCGDHAHNISFVTGTHYTQAIIRALEIYKPGIPTVWNSGGYERLETLHALSEYIDIWLPDYKFALPAVAEKYAHAPDYPSVAMNAIQFMCDTAGENVIEDGILKKGVIVRHLVLPKNVRNSVAALRKISSELPRGTLVSIMSQYTPAGNISAFSELGRRLTAAEYEKVLDTADTLGLTGFRQELSSAAEEYVPDFDLTIPE